MDYEVSANNIRLKSSFAISKEDFERELAAIRDRHPDSLVWNRSMDFRRKCSREELANSFPTSEQRSPNSTSFLTKNQTIINLRLTAKYCDEMFDEA